MRNDPDISPQFLRELAEAEEHGRQAREEIDRIPSDQPKADDWDKIDTAVRRLEEAERKIVDATREKQQSGHEINVHVEVPHRRDSSEPPEVAIGVGPGHLKFKGWKAIAVGIGVAALVAASWYAGSRGAHPPEVHPVPAHEH